MNKSWGDGVHVDVVFAPLDRQTLREVYDGGLGHAINAFCGERGKSCLRTHINNATVLLADHDAPGSLAGEERAFQVDGKRGVEVFFGYILGKIVRRDSGVVHQNIEPTEVLGSLVD